MTETTPPPAAPPAPKRPLLRVLLSDATGLVVLTFLLRLALGLFVLGHACFLIGYNFLDAQDSARDGLTRKRKGTPSEREFYDRIVSLPAVGPLLDEWVQKEQQSRLHQALERPHNWVTWYACKTGQEQGWSLFAPDTHTSTCFIAVQLRWDDHPDPPQAGAGNQADALPPRLLLSRNEPKDIHHYLRFGEFRTRRIESRLETPLRLSGHSREEQLANWEERVRDRVKGDRAYILMFLRLRLREFQKEHPDLPTPRQVILRSRTWCIPGADRAPWDWEDHTDENMVRWRPHLFPEPTPDDLEVFIHTEARFENKRWPNPPPFPPMPGSSD